MSQMTQRQIEIVRFLSRNGGAATGQQLADAMGVSLRTLQKEASRLKELGLVESTNTGYRLLAAEGEAPLGAEQPCGAENDRAQLLRRLLLADAPCDLYDLADELFLSVTALRSRLRDVDRFLAGSSLRVKLKSGEVWIEGSELNKRRMIRDMIYQETSPGIGDFSNSSRYLSGIDFPRLREMIVSAIHCNGCLVAEPYSSNLILNIVIGICRVKQGMHSAPTGEPPLGAGDIEYRIAQEICARCGKHWSIAFTENDLAYFAALFRGQLSSGGSDSDPAGEQRQFEAEIGDIITDAFEHYMLAIDFSPYLHNIAVHIRELIKRGAAENYAVNNMHMNIRDNCPFVYDVAVLIAQKLERKYRIRIPDDEIGFLSVHIGLVIENATQETDRVNVLICASGYQNIAGSIEQKLQGIYGGLIETSAAESLFEGGAPAGNPDLILSTVPVNVLGREVVQISPFFNIMDRTRVDTAINSCLKIKELRRSNNYLASCFHEALFFRNAGVQDRDGAIRFLAGKMVEFGVAGDGFLDSVFERERASSTCFFERFAIPHPIEMSANKTMIAVLIEDDGVDWQGQRIKLCLLFAVSRKDRNHFSKAYNGAVHALCDDIKFQKLVRARSLPEFLAVLRR